MEVIKPLVDLNPQVGGNNMTYDELVQTVISMQSRIDALEKLVQKKTQSISLAGVNPAHKEFYEKKMESLKEHN